MKVKKLLSLLVVLVLVVAMAACAPAETTPSDSPSAPSTPPASAPETPDASDEIDTKGMTFYWIGKVMGGTYWTGVETGLQAACDELGITLNMQGLDRETDVERQISLLQDAVTAQPDAILIAPCDSQALDTPVKEAFKNANCPIVLVDTRIATQTEGFTAAILTNNFEAGRTCAKLMAENLKAKGVTEGVIGVDVASTGSQTVIDRLDGFRDYWENDADLPDVKVLWEEIKVDDADHTKTISNTKDLMTAHPNLVGMFGGTGTSVSIGTAMKESNRKDIVVIGMDFNVDSYNHVRDGWMQGSCAQRTYVMGYEGVMLAVKAIKGEEIPELFIDSGLLEVTPDIIDSKEVQDYIALITSAQK